MRVLKESKMKDYELFVKEITNADSRIPLKSLTVEMYQDFLQRYRDLEEKDPMKNWSDFINWSSFEFWDFMTD